MGRILNIVPCSQQDLDNSTRACVGYTQLQFKLAQPLLAMLTLEFCINIHAYKKKVPHIHG